MASPLISRKYLICNGLKFDTPFRLIMSSKVTQYALIFLFLGSKLVKCGTIVVGVLPLCWYGEVFGIWECENLKKTTQIAMKSLCRLDLH